LAYPALKREIFLSKNGEFPVSSPFGTLEPLLRTHHLQFALAVLLASPLSGAPLYSVVNLGNVGASRNSAFAVNGSGVAAGTVRRADGADVPAIFGPEGARTLSGSAGQASGINASGTVVGTTITSSGARATVWEENGERVLSTLGGAESYALAVNNAGNVVGSSTTADGYAHAFLTLADGVVDLGTLGGGWSSAYGVNDRLEVVGYSMTSSGAFNAFHWSESTGMSAIPALGGANSYAFGLNERGSVVGAANTSNGMLEAFLYADGSSRSLGTLGGYTSSAYAINSIGDVVGYSYDNQGRSRAFVWRGGILYDLNNLVEDLDGWTLDAAFGINEDGEIVGRGSYNGQFAAFRLKPLKVEPLQTRQPATAGFAPSLSSSATSDLAPVPEPGTSVLVLLGAALLWFWKTDPRSRTRR
jgi:probable HAF family extracellular repeat protein